MCYQNMIRLNKVDAEVIERFRSMVGRVGFKQTVEAMKGCAALPLHRHPAACLDVMIDTNHIDVDRPEDIQHLASLMVAFIHGWTLARESLKRGEV